jgi:MOSC domain-containing protein YiiM
MEIRSDTMGDPARYRSFDDLERALRALPPAPKERGRVALIVARGDGGLRSTPDRVRLEPGRGIPGDAWGRRPHASADGSITAMRRDVAELLANGQPIALAGDQLFVDLDLRLPPGTRLRAGRALLEVTPKPHNGCGKFSARFGPDALRLTAEPRLRPLNLRGVYLKVVEAGELAPGDAIDVLTK